MANFLRTVLVQNQVEAADRTFQIDLPVNPLSQVLITVRATKDGVDGDSGAAEILRHITEASISFRGQDIVRGSLADLAMVNWIVCGCPAYGYRQQDADGETHSITVPITLGRRPYMVTECFPAVRRGDLVLELDIVADTGTSDGLTLQIETIELLDETPANYLKYTASSHTFASTGQEDVRLPIGNPLLGVLLRGTTVPAGTATTATWERDRLQVDNVEALYARFNWDTVHGEMGRRMMGNPSVLDDHAHRYDGAAAAFSNTGAAQQVIAADRVSGLYGYMDFDPLMDGSYMLETAGRADVVLQRDAGTADLGTFIPIEWVAVRGAGS